MIPIIFLLLLIIVIKNLNHLNKLSSPSLLFWGFAFVLGSTLNLFLPKKGIWSPKTWSSSSTKAEPKASQKRGQITLGVFPNCHECQKIDFPVLKNLRLFTSWPKTHGV